MDMNFTTTAEDMHAAAAELNEFYDAQQARWDEEDASEGERSWMNDGYDF
jgi:hypothetical protein